MFEIFYSIPLDMLIESRSINCYDELGSNGFEFDSIPSVGGRIGETENLLMKRLLPDWDQISDLDKNFVQISIRPIRLACHHSILLNGKLR